MTDTLADQIEALWAEYQAGRIIGATVMAKLFEEIPTILTALRDTEALRAVLAAIPTAEWQDIATAPRAGWFLGYWPDCEFEDRVCPTIWHDGYPDDSRFMDSADFREEQPTHWMPLPSAPGTTPSPQPTASQERAQIVALVDQLYNEADLKAAASKTGWVRLQYIGAKEALSELKFQIERGDHQQETK